MLVLVSTAVVSVAVVLVATASQAGELFSFDDIHITDEEIVADLAAGFERYDG